MWWSKSQYIIVFKELDDGNDFLLCQLLMPQLQK